MIRIADDGPGLGEAELSRLGIRGRRLDETKPGAGLGLAIAREIVALNDGAMTFGKARPRRAVLPPPSSYRSRGAEENSDWFEKAVQAVSTGSGSGNHPAPRPQLLARSPAQAARFWGMKRFWEMKPEPPRRGSTVVAIR